MLVCGLVGKGLDQKGDLVIISVHLSRTCFAQILFLKLALAEVFFHQVEVLIDETDHLADPILRLADLIFFGLQIVLLLPQVALHVVRVKPLGGFGRKRD